VSRLYSVYVVELDPAASSTGGPCVYVGETALTPDERFKRHLAGHRASRVVTRYGTRLRPDLADGIGPFPSKEDALQAERALAHALRARGFEVFGGQGEPFVLRTR
jgi:hypothetical protein